MNKILEKIYFITEICGSKRSIFLSMPWKT